LELHKLQLEISKQIQKE